MFNHSVNYVIAALLVLLLCYNIFRHHKFVNYAILLLLLLLLLQDQNRWQPWVYIYLLLLLPFSFTGILKENETNKLAYFQVIFIGIYFWSGVHKFNQNFLDTTYVKLLTIFLDAKNNALIDQVKLTGYLIPVTEIAVAVLLFFPKTRKYGVFLGLATHAFILIFIGPLGLNINTIIYPWNIAMALLLVLLFYKTSLNIFTKPKLPWSVLAIGALTWLVPLLNFFGYWDDYLSFSLYSDKTKAFFVAIGDAELHKLDAPLHEHLIKTGGINIIDVNEWSMKELNVPLYPESRVFNKIAATFCTNNIAENQLYFLEFEQPIEANQYTRFTCSKLKN
ncbi:MAG: hypothetical protein LPK19_17685 [Hymenobacteraceae bacterium]|nr:hypothetical protein [Hymenobacteraceae bacterium]MDX5398088.1 hypothetical protein [Hymenobacteraceae bacterium]MDX5514160.1 hypothetical protein [Hymenobacteraceae bacterium]